ncbi:MAG: hypothetical protein WC656_03575 [Sulfurimonas sp.]|jgi:hypothetical protein
MKIVFIGLLILLIHGSLGASSELEIKKQLCPRVYPLKIIFGNYLQKDKAELVLKKLQEDEVYEKLNVMAKENDFMVHMRPLAGYNILVIEPIINNEIHEKVMNIMKTKFEDVYSVCAKPSKSTSNVVEQVQKEVQEVKVVEQVQKEVKAVKEIQNEIAKQLEISVPQVKEKAKEVNEYSSLKRFIWLFVLVLLSALLLFYNLKYKKNKE